MFVVFRAKENGDEPLYVTRNSDCNGRWKALSGLGVEAR
ncbi:U32 family peptidase, partial [Klebsiella pneumoniae]|nr:U32 family peptidase [Klebsiella pneumoniae]